MHPFSNFLKVLFVSIIIGNIQVSTGQSTSVLDTLEHFIIENNYPLQSLFSRTKILSENAETISIKDILENSDKIRFKPLLDSTISENKVVWLHISIHPKLTLENQQIIFKSTYKNYPYTTPHDSILTYYVKRGKLMDSTKSGVFIPASQKKIPFPVDRNSFPISLLEDEPVDLYFKIYDQNQIYTQLEIREPNIPFPQYSSSRWLPAFALILSVYVLAFFFYTKDRSYLYLFGFYTFIAMYENYVENNLPFIEIFFSETPKASVVVWLTLTLGSKVFFLQFGRKFTNLKSISPLWDKIVIGLIGYFILAIFIQVTLLIFGVNPLNYLQFIFAGIGFLGVLIVTIRLFFFQDTLLKYFVASSIWSFIFSILGILWENGIIPFWDTFNPWLIANTGLMFILALAIARKMQLSERAKSEVEKIREIDSVKSKFFANISHEFRTPLSLILGPINQSIENIPATETIEDTIEVPVKGKHLNVMKRNALRLQNLVDQILDLSKLDQGKMNLQVAKGNVVQFIRSIVFSFESLTEIKHIQFKTHFPKDIEESYFDKDKLEKILVNLLSNAIKFTPEHGVVSVSVEETSKNIKISITDTGNGLKTEEIAKIFDRFYQTETTQDQGTGIGLALVKELVDLHHGQISVDSTEGIGTTFKVLLPYRKTDFNSNEVIHFETENASTKMNHTLLLSEEETTLEVKEQTDSPLLLIVEDNPDLRNYIAEQMESQFNIITAKDGKEGFSKATVEIPDIIISDVMMPKMNGFELCEKLKTDIKVQ